MFSPTELNYQHCLLTIDCNTVAICMISERTFKIFYSHSRDLYGIPDPFSKCVLIYVENLENLSTFFSNTTTTFEVRGVKSSLLNTVAGHDNHDIRQGKISNEKEIQLEKCRQKYKEKKANETTEITGGPSLQVFLTNFLFFTLNFGNRTSFDYTSILSSILYVFGYF